MKWLKHDHQQETSNIDLVLQKIDARIEAQHRRQNNLLDLRIDERIEEEQYQVKKQEITTEITRLEKDRANTKYHAADWIKRAENRINYARYAKEKLANKTPEEKTEILAGLGSNFLLDDGVLRCDLDPVLTIFKNNHETVNAFLPCFEPTRALQQQENSEITQKWWAYLDSPFGY
jgi:hypothetical protein